MTYAEAMRRYGSDKPDTRFEMELVDLTDYFEGTDFKIFASSEHVGRRRRAGRRLVQPARSSTAGTSGRAAGAARASRTSSSTPTATPAAASRKNLREQELQGLAGGDRGGSPGDAIFFQAGPTLGDARGARRARGSRQRVTAGILPDSRLELPVGHRRADVRADRRRRRLDVGAPPVHPAARRGRGDLTERPGDALAVAYDVVLNGTEIGGGSLRIHERELQEKVFTVLGLSEEEARAQFGFLLDAFRFGPPPHGGIAFGWDRICMIAAGASSIRDVIAFPKTASGGDPLTGAPTPITAAQRKEAGIDFVPEPRNQDQRCHDLGLQPRSWLFHDQGSVDHGNGCGSGASGE